VGKLQEEEYLMLAKFPMEKSYPPPKVGPRYWQAAIALLFDVLTRLYFYLEV